MGTISGPLWPRWSNARIGPFVNGTDIYAVVVDETNATIEVWRSTDGGGTWAEADSANHGIYESDALEPGWRSVSATQLGTTIYLSWWETHTEGDFSFGPFSMSSNTWGTVTPNNDTAVNKDIDALNLVPGLQVAFRSDGDRVIGSTANSTAVMGSDYRRAGYGLLEGSTFTGNLSLDGAGSAQLHYDFRDVVMGSSDRAFLFYTDSTNADLLCKTLTSANTLNALTTIDATANVGMYSTGHALTYTHSATARVAIPYVDSNGDLRLAYATQADSPTWSTSLISSAHPPEYTNSNPASLVYVGTTLYCFWVKDSDQTIYRAESTDGGATWGTATQWKSGVTANGISIGAVGSNIGVLYNATSTVTYEEYSLGPGVLALTGTSAGSSTTATTGPVSSKTLTGTVSASSASAGTVTKAVTLTGSVTASSDTAGSATAVRSLTGTVAGDSTAAGTITKASTIAGAITASSAAAGSLSYVGLPLTGTSAGSSATAGTIAKASSLAGSAAGTSAVAGSITQSSAITGTSTGTSTADGTVTATGTLTGAVTASSDTSGTATLAATLTGTSAGSSLAAGDTETAGELDLDGSSTGTSAATGTVTVAGTLMGSTTASSDAQGNTTLAATLTGASTATSDASGIAGASIPAAGSVIASSDAAGTANVAVSLTGTVAGSSLAEGDATAVGEEESTGSAAGSSDAAGYATITYAATGSATATSTVSGDMTITITLTGTATGTSAGAGSALFAGTLVGYTAGTSNAVGLLTVGTGGITHWTTFAASAPVTAWSALAPITTLAAADLQATARDALAPVTTYPAPAPATTYTGIAPVTTFDAED